MPPSLLAVRSITARICGRSASTFSGGTRNSHDGESIWLLLDLGAGYDVSGSVVRRVKSPRDTRSRGRRRARETTGTSLRIGRLGESDKLDPPCRASRCRSASGATGSPGRRPSSRSASGGSRPATSSSVSDDEATIDDTDMWNQKNSRIGSSASGLLAHAVAITEIMPPIRQFIDKRAPADVLRATRIKHAMPRMNAEDRPAEGEAEHIFDAIPARR